MLRKVCWIPLTLLLVLNAACVTQSRRIVGADAVHDAGELHDWTALGRLGVTGAQQSASGGFTWQQESDSSDVHLRGPAGLGSLIIHVQGQSLTMEASDGTQYDAEHALTELQLRLGAPVPVTQLRYWVRGLAAPGEHSWSEPGLALEQDGWQIRYSDWLQRDGLRLPGRVILSREQVRIVLVVQEWRLAA